MSILSFYQRGIQKLADAEKSVVSRLAGGLKVLGSAQNQITQQAAQSVQQVSRPTTGTANVLTNAVKQVSSGVQSLPSAITSFRDRVQSGDIPQEYKATPFDILKSRANSAVRPFTQPLKPFVSPFQRIFNQPKIITIQGRDSQPSPITQFGRGLSSGINSTFKPLEKIFGAPPTPDEFKMSSQFAINKARGLPTTPEMEAANQKIGNLTFNAVAGTVERPKAIVDTVLKASKNKLPAALNIIKPAKNSATQSLAQKLESNIRTDKLGISSESAQKELQTILDDADNFTAQRRGVQTFQMTEEAADKILPKIKLKPGTTLNAEEKSALGNLVKGYSDEIDSLAKAIKEGANNDENLLQLAKLRTNYQTAIASLSGATTEAARSLSAGRMINKLLTDPRIRQDERMMKEALKFAGGREGVAKIAKRLGEFGDDTIGKYKFIQQLSNPDGLTKLTNFLDWYYYNSLLSGPKTQLRNILGNTFHIGFNTAAKPVAGLVDATKSGAYRLVGKKRLREVYAGELPAEVKGMFTGIPEAFSKAKFMMKNGFSLDDMVESEFAKPEMFSKILGGRLAMPANIVSRSMQATDQFFRTVVANSELHALAYKSAKNKGLKGDAYKQAVADFLDNPPIEAIEAMHKAAVNATFQNPNKVASGIDKLVKNIKLDNGTEIFNPLKFIVPFVKTPTNIIARSAEASGLGLFTGALRSNGRESSQVMGRALLGGIGLAFLWTKAQQGQITGSGPKDKEMRDALYATGWKPNSVKIGDKYYGYQLFAPLSQALSIIGNANDQNIYDGVEPSVDNILWGVGNSLTQNSFLEGLDQLNQAIQYQDLSYITKNVAGAAVPFSALMRTIATGQDNKIREASSAIDAIKSNLPAGIPLLGDFNRQSVPIKRDIFGRELEYEGGVLKRMLDPFNIGSKKIDRESELANEALRLGVKIQAPDRKQELTNMKTGEKTKLNQEQKSQYSKSLGEMMSVTLDRAISSPEYQNLSDDEKRIYLEERIADAKKFIDGSFFIDSLSPDQKRELSIKVIDYSIAVPTETKDLEVFDPQSGSKIDLSPEDKSAYYERMWQGIYDTVTTGEQREEFQYLDPEQKKDFVNSQVSNLKSFMKDGFTMFKNDEEGFFDDSLRLKLQLDADSNLKNALIDNAVKKTFEFMNTSESDVTEFVLSEEMAPYINKIESDEDENRFFSGITKLYQAQGSNAYEQFLLNQDSETRAMYVFAQWKTAQTQQEEDDLLKKLGEYEQVGIFDKSAQNKFIELMEQDAINQTTQDRIKEENDNSKKQFWPTQSKNITSTYGHRTGVSPAWHSGVDIGGQTGDPVYSSKAGTVVQVDSSPGGYGNSILVDHGNGIMTRYGHLSGFNVKVGDTVSQGDVIGSLGSTGNSTGPHLHYEVIQDGKQIDPMKYEEFSY